MTSSAHAPLTLELKDEGGQDELSVRRRRGDGHRRRRREGNVAPPIVFFSVRTPKVAVNQLFTSAVRSLFQAATNP